MTLRRCCRDMLDRCVLGEVVRVGASVNDEGGCVAFVAELVRQVLIRWVEADAGVRLVGGLGKGVITMLGLVCVVVVAGARAYLPAQWSQATSLGRHSDRNSPSKYSRYVYFAELLYLISG